MKELFGDMPLSSFIAAMIFALIGSFIQKRFVYKKAKNNDVVVHFSLVFWIRDNGMEMFLNFLITFILVRFGPDLVKYFSPESVVFFENASGMMVYLVLGFFQTLLVRRLKNKLKYIS